jgi:hypothetical protein
LPFHAVDKCPKNRQTARSRGLKGGTLKKMGMTVYNPDGTVASVFQGIERDGNKLVLKQLALGQLPMDVIITPEEGLKSLGMGMSLGLLTFILLFPYFYFSYRGEKKKKAAAPATDKPKA